MADKKITELLLIDAATSDVNFAGDDGTQTYRVTAAQLKAYIADAIEARLDAIEADNWVTNDRLNDDISFVNMPKVGSDSIVESGSNGNGYFVKYSDGTLINTGIAAVPTSSANAWGSVFAPFAAPYIDTNYYIIASLGEIITNAATMAAGRRSTAAGGNIACLISAGGSYNHDVQWMAIGRWKL